MAHILKHFARHALAYVFRRLGLNAKTANLLARGIFH